MVSDGDDQSEERIRRTRGRNRALLGILLALVALFYIISLVRIGR